MDWLAKERYYSRLERFAKVYARMLLNANIEWDKLGRIYNTKEQIPELKAKKLLKSKTVQNMVTEELVRITETHGISAETALNTRKRLLNKAMKDGNLSAANKALDAFDEKLDLIPVKERIIKKQTLSLSGFLPAGLIPEKEVKQLKKATK